MDRNDRLNLAKSSLARTLLLGTALATLTTTAVKAQVQPMSTAAPSAGSQLQEVVVTARRREESLQKVPVSVTAVTNAQIQARGSFDILDLQQVTPGLTETVTTHRQDVDFSIRGQTRTGGTITDAVIPYFSEVPLPRISQGEFYDLAGIQVLKGPQGTLFGKVTDGGAVLLSPIRPANDFSGYVQEKVGDYGLHDTQAAINIPILQDKVLLRIAGEDNRRNGYTKDLFDGKKLDDISYDGVRAGLLININDRLSNYTIVSWNYSNQNGTSTFLTGYNPAAIPAPLQPLLDSVIARQNQQGPRAVDSGNSGPAFRGQDGLFYTRQTSWIFNTTTYRANDDLTIKNIFGRVWDKEAGASDEIDFPGLAIGTNNSPVLPYYRVEQYTDELQAQGKAFGGRLNYVTGAFGEFSHPGGPSETGATLYGAEQIYVDSKVQTQSAAVYGQGSYDLSDFVKGLKFDLGLRYSKDNIKVSNAEYVVLGLGAAPVPHGQCESALSVLSNNPGVIPFEGCLVTKGSSDAVTFNVGLNYQLDASTLIYAKISRGYRPGGVNPGQTGGILPLVYAPEYDLSHEIGLKKQGRVFDMPYRVNVDAFYDNGSNVQQQVLEVTQGPNPTPQTGILSASKTVIQGVEFDGTLIPVRGLTLNLSWAYNEGHFEKSQYSGAQIVAACPVNPLVNQPSANGIYCPLQAINLLPRNSGTFAVNYVLTLSPEFGEISIGGDYYHTDKQASSDSRLPVTPLTPLGGYTPGYDLLNFNVTWRGVFGRPIDLQAFITNATDKVYFQGVNNFLDKGSLGVSSALYGPPRMFGVSLKYHWGTDHTH